MSSQTGPERPSTPFPGRRELGLSLASLAMASGVQAQPSAATGPRPVALCLIHPGMVMLDLVGPMTVLNILGAEIHLAWKDLRPVTTDLGLPVVPTVTLEGSPRAPDVLLVPGGLNGTVALMRDPAVLDFLASRGEAARWVTSICTGGLLLGAAGLLRGREATAHWYVRDLLALMGARPSAARVVTDGNRVTGGGVTAGLDFGLRLAGLMAGEATAQRIQLVLEYQPAPPFDAGSPEGAGPAITEAVLTARAPLLTAARSSAEAARMRLGL